MQLNKPMTVACNLFCIKFSTQQADFEIHQIQVLPVFDKLIYSLVIELS